MYKGLKTEDKVQGGVSNVPVDSQVEVEVLEVPKSPEGTTEETEIERDGEQATQEQPRPLRRSSRTVVPPSRYGWEDEDDHVSYALFTEVGDPCSYREAIEADDSDRWMTAIQQEMESLEKNQTWDLVPLPRGSRAIGCRWIFQKKDCEQYKARLVAKGYAQKEGMTTTRYSHL